jgi:hypothetical protein
MSTLAVFLVLGGGAAFAASHLAKNSVGTPQLKKNAVTAAKLKNGAVTGPKVGAGAVGGDALANGAVTGGKLADGAVGTGKLGSGSVTTGKLAAGSVTADKLAAGVIPGVPVVRHLGGAATLEFPPVTKVRNPVTYPAPSLTFTQPAGEDDLFVASMQVHIPASCLNSRSAEATLFLDAGSGRSNDEVVGRAIVDDPGSGDRNLTVHFVPGEITHGIVNAAPSAPTPHTFSIKLNGSSCNGKAEVASGIVATSAQIDVIGIR